MPHVPLYGVHLREGEVGNPCAWHVTHGYQFTPQEFDVHIEKVHGHGTTYVHIVYIYIL